MFLFFVDQQQEYFSPLVASHAEALFGIETISVSTLVQQVNLQLSWTNNR